MQASVFRWALKVIYYKMGSAEKKREVENTFLLKENNVFRTSS